jgi:phage gp29-like protein
MAVGISSYLATAWLDAMGNNSSFAVATAYMKLHVGDPGAAGTSNAATETTRKAVSFGAASAGTISNDAQVQWTNIAGSQDATHWSLWDNESAGNFLGSGTITANAYTAGDTLTFAIGDIDISLTIAS